MEYIRKKNAKMKMEEKMKNGVEYLQFELLTQTGIVKHLFSTRQGGCSSGYLGTMNLSYARGDAPENVDENYRRIADVLGCRIEDFVMSDQTHTVNIRKVTEKDRGKGVAVKKDYTDVDGLITNEKNLVLVTSFADCVPLFFVDTVKHAIGLSHSGWRGTVGRIGAHTIACMEQEYGSKPQDIVAAIGPSICGECYEVDKDVAEQFLKEFSLSPNLDKIVRKKKDQKYQLDLWEANRTVLIQAGILEEHLQITDICTCCNSQKLFSHRASHGQRGNLAAFLTLDV